MKPGMLMTFVVLAATSAGADEVYLRGGGRISGIIVEESPQSIELEIGAGHITVSRSGVDRIVRLDSPLATYRAKAAALAYDDAAGWLALAQWARQSELGTQAREAYTHVLDVEPGNAIAHRALGDILEGDRWMSHDSAMQAQGYVLMEGEWVSPAQREAILADRESARRDRLEAASRRAELDEAEARTHLAEARAAAAEAEAQKAASTFVVVGVGPYGGAPFDDSRRSCDRDQRVQAEGPRQHDSRPNERHRERKQPERSADTSARPASAGFTPHFTTPASVFLERANKGTMHLTQEADNR